MPEARRRRRDRRQCLHLHDPAASWRQPTGSVASVARPVADEAHLLSARAQKER
jgi:hypothetical protein